MTEHETLKDAAMKPELEKMSDFFAARADIYDEHMLNDVKGCREGYIRMAGLIPDGTETILDLGCGTGLELAEIFKRFPEVSVVGIDITAKMLELLRQKYPGRNIKLICGDYFDVELGESIYDTAVSFETMHHFSHDKKVRLYEKIRKSLKPGGLYIECDYMVEEQSAEDELFKEAGRLRRELNIRDDEIYHFDTPCTVENQLSMLKKAGFMSAEKIWRQGNTTLIIGKKELSL